VLIFFFYLLVLAVMLFLRRKNSGKGIFKTSKKVAWFVSGISLLMYYVSVEQGQVITGILEEKGLWGLWVFWPSLLGAMVVPIVIAPLWEKLDFITDNQFLLFRYFGKPARILHQFRSVYVGGFVVAFLLSFHILAFSNVIESCFFVSHTFSVWIAGGALVIFALKNTYDLKIRTDVFHAILYFLSLVIAFYFLVDYSGGWNTSLQEFKSTGLSKTSLLPPNDKPKEWGLFFVFIGVQWWSAQLFDGGGPEMSRFTATKGRWNVIKAAILPVILYIVLSILMIMMAVMTISLQSSNSSEKGFMEMIFKVVPKEWESAVFLGFFAMFITTSESIMNWGGSFLSIDLYKTYLFPSKSKKHYTLISFLSMALLCLLAAIIAQYSFSLKYLILIVFSISAGVAPVYILRWFWNKISAWTQLSAMIASCVFTLVCEFLKLRIPWLFNSFYFDAYTIQLLLVTVLTTVVWLAVTFLVKSEMNQKFIDFKRSNYPSRVQLVKLIFLALSLGFILLILNVLLISILIR
jgi:SSS family solute:Na+ symporter